MSPSGRVETALDAALAVARALDRHDVPYAIGGALAYGMHVVPRATHDVDLHVFAAPTALTHVFAALASIGITCDTARDTRAAADQGMFIAHLDGSRPDIFVPSIALSAEAARTRVCRRVEGQDVWFLSAEALCVFMLLYFRAKDVADLERAVGFLGARLDVTYVRRAMVALMGDDDERVAAWDELVAQA